MWDGTSWVPNPYRPVLAPPVAAPYESADFRALMIAIFLAVNVIGVALFLAFDGMELFQLQQATRNDTVYFAEGMIAILAVLAYYGSFIPAVVFFCMWVHRVVRNMPALGSPDPRWTPRGAVIRCFVPFLNLLHPVYSVLDAWRGSRLDRRWNDLSSRMSLSPPFLIVGWWTAWLLARFISWFSYSLQRSGDLDMQTAGYLSDIVGNMLLIASALLAILVVRDITGRQETKNRLVASGQLV